MQKFLCILLIAIVACITAEEEKANIIDSIKDGAEKVKDKTIEISEKVKEMAEDASEKVKKAAEEAGKKVKGAAEDVSSKAKEIAEDISATSKEVAKNFVKFFEKLSKEIQNGIIWLKENGYWDQIVNIAQTAGKAAAIIGCKAVFPAGIALCDPIVNFIFKAIISIIEQIKKKAEENKQA
jgi:hypothetical protein